MKHFRKNYIYFEASQTSLTMNVRPDLIRQINFFVLLLEK